MLDWPLLLCCTQITSTSEEILMRKLVCFVALLLFAATLGSAHTVDTVVMRAIMLPQNEVPPATGVEAQGLAAILVHVTREGDQITGGVVDFNIFFNFAGATNFVGLHIHEGPAGVAAPVVIPTNLSAANPVQHGGGPGTILRQVVVTDGALLGRLLANPGGFYANIHNTAFPGGVMRGQLALAETRVLRTALLTTNEVPPLPNPVDASGSAVIRLFAFRDGSGQITDGTAEFDVNFRFADPVN